MGLRHSAVAAAKARGRKLGGYCAGMPKPDSALGVAAIQNAADAFAADVGPMLHQLRATGASLRQIADAMASKGIATARGKVWTATAVKNALERLAA